MLPKIFPSNDRPEAKADATPEPRPTRRHRRFAGLVEHLEATGQLPSVKARTNPATTDKPTANRFAHLKALSPAAAPVIAPVAAQQPRREAATQPKDEAAAIVARFAKVARIASGEEPAPAAHKPPPAAAALIERMKAVYNEGVK